MPNKGLTTYRSSHRKTKRDIKNKKRALSTQLETQDFMTQFLSKALIVVFCLVSLSAQAKPLEIIAYGDSLTAGFGLARMDAFPSKLQRTLSQKGYNVEMINAGLSGDTSAGGLERLEWSLDEAADGVILALGANDMLRGIDPDTTRSNLEDIIVALRERNIPVMLIGMRAAPNMGEDFAKEFDAIYPDLAEEYDLILMPFMLEGVAGDPRLNQEDGMHPTSEGVEVMVQNALPFVEDFLSGLSSEVLTGTTK